MFDPTLEATKAVLEKWTPSLALVAETSPAVPIPVLTGEALDLAYFVAERCEPTNGKQPLPGMRSLVTSGAIEESIAQDLRELGRAHTLRQELPGALDAQVREIGMGGMPICARNARQRWNLSSAL